jgi:intraflagellar transport protein 122
MRPVLSWQVNAAEGKEGTASSPVYDCCFNPAGTQLVVACGNLVLVYDPTDGLLMHRLRGHKDTVYCVTYAKDGKRFASGGADKNVIIWKSTAEGILKYGHNDSIQALSYNPVTLQLASVTASDFGIWSPDQKSVSKYKISAKGLCCSWSNDGQLLAIGQFDGTVTVRNKAGEAKYTYLRGGPVWSVSFNPSTLQNTDILAVTAWDQTLVFYSLDDYSSDKKPAEQRVMGREKQLGMDPCCVRYFVNGEYMAMSGSDNKAYLWTKDGVRLVPICERESWIWCVAPRPKQNYVAVGTNDGMLAVYQLVFATVHGLYQERYAYRDFMTDVIIQHLTLENKKVRIKCKDHVKKIAVYKDRLAVQLPDKVLIYELKGDDDNDMKYCKKDQILRALECNLLVVTSEHVILCLERKLQLLNFKGDKEREWVLDAVIRYIKVVGGPPRREGLLVGLKNGQVLKIYVDNLFPIPVVTHDRAIRCLDLSASRRKLALVDQFANVVVYDMNTQEKLFEDQNANSVAWNSVLENQLCYSGKDQLSIKTGDFPVHREKMQGYVVGVRGSKVFCLHQIAMGTVNVPQSAAMYRFLEKKLMAEAYTVIHTYTHTHTHTHTSIHIYIYIHMYVCMYVYICIHTHTHTHTQTFIYIYIYIYIYI